MISVFIIQSIIYLLYIIYEHREYESDLSIQEETSLLSHIIGLQLSDEGLEMKPINFIIFLSWIFTAVLTLI